VSDLSTKLLQLKKQDEQAGKLILRIEGEIKQMTGGLKKRFNVSSVEKAENLLKKKILLREKKEAKLEADMEVLETEYVFD
jgi:hypothetical protein